MNPTKSICLEVPNMEREKLLDRQRRKNIVLAHSNGSAAF